MIIAMKVAAIWSMVSIAFGLAVGPFLRTTHDALDRNSEMARPELFEVGLDGALGLR
jgi:hypothetical protein